MKELDQLLAVANNPDEFERIRSEIIQKHFQSIPEKHRASCLALQEQIDAVRKSASPEETMRFIRDRMSEKLDELQVQVSALAEATAKKETDEIIFFIKKKFTLGS